MGQAGQRRPHLQDPRDALRTRDIEVVDDDGHCCCNGSEREMTMTRTMYDEMSTFTAGVHRHEISATSHPSRLPNKMAPVRTRDSAKSERPTDIRWISVQKSKSQSPEEESGALRMSVQLFQIMISCGVKPRSRVRVRGRQPQTCRPKAHGPQAWKLRAMYRTYRKPTVMPSIVGLGRQGLAVAAWS